MANLKQNTSVALAVLPSDNANIPYPSQATSGTNTSASSDKLIDSGATFITDNVMINDIVYNTTDSSAATVVSVDSETQLTLNANIFTAGSKDYVVYDTQSINNGCLLWVGGAGTVKVVTAGGQTVTITAPIGILGGTAPLNVTKVFSTGTSATLMVALF